MLSHVVSQTLRPGKPAAIALLVPLAGYGQSVSQSNLPSVSVQHPTAAPDSPAWVMQAELPVHMS